ncbi:hypothetical protein [Oceanihabitans sediminis]|uniref:Uncharacterized protein n=1 Tax=Oceanihabitans sediminis TaxID=1812012 RepID=A0A368P252_9FLAO|nr:hypothetical protein [Oceanihabitans sediminis]MDX1279052.1 hypothetical protein [Oceanihabitans sediminis]MDX1774716.1 hypothetical protein [Oceanihabitans sediminis]RBP27620.1 hypothetical protein DFR65_1094 [Oceanihabitans sediminis]RCU56486.1 hypothetical protein DU428_12995 [Oceanihabitans sediminis]
MTNKLLTAFKGFGFSLLFILLGIYILETSEMLIGKIIGTACIVFFGVLFALGIFKLIKDAKK